MAVGLAVGAFGVLGAGGGTVAAALPAVLLGARNAFYGLRLSTVLGVRGVRRFAAAQFVIDESSAVSAAQRSDRAARWGFWATGLAVFVLWNAGTLLGAFGRRVDRPSGARPGRGR